jgi:hypothetical protein
MKKETLATCQQLVEEKQAIKALRTLMNAENMSLREAKPHIDRLIETKKKQ